MSVFQEVNSMDLKVHNSFNTKLNSLANPIRKSSLAGKSGADTSQTLGINNHYAYSCKLDNQPKLIKGNKLDPVAKHFRKGFQHDHYAYSNEQDNKSELIKGKKMDPEANPFGKSFEPQLLAETKSGHGGVNSPENVHVALLMKDLSYPFKEIKDQCFIVAT